MPLVLPLGVCVGAGVVEGTLGLGGDVGGFSGGSWQVWLILGDSGFVSGCSGDSLWPSVLGWVLGGIDAGGRGSDVGPWILPCELNWCYFDTQSRANVLVFSIGWLDLWQFLAKTGRN
jgi:hypothetical protein